MCGICGMYGHPKNMELLRVATDSIQHRGQNACGAAALGLELNRIEYFKDMGLVVEVFGQEEYLELSGKAAISHVRWPTQGSNSKRNIQPHYTQGLQGRIAIAVNGDVVNMAEQMAFLDEKQIRVYSGNDAEMMSAAIYWQLIRRGLDKVEDSIGKMMKWVKGGYAAVFMADWKDALYAFRDPHGIRPLLVGMVDGRYIVASETCQLKKVGADFICEVKPGEIIRFDDSGKHHFQGVPAEPLAFCCFEKLYFARPDSLHYFIDMEGNFRFVEYKEIRKDLGRVLAQEAPVITAEVVVAAPNSGIPAATGFAEVSGIPYDPQAVVAEGGRTFIEADRGLRKKKAEEKYTISPASVAGKVVVIIDDSSIKTLTMKTLIRKLYEAGAKEVHVRIASPQYIHPCHYGAETKAEWELGAKDKTPEEFSRAVGNPNSFAFLSIDKFKQVIEQYGQGNCYACFTGEYPVPLPGQCQVCTNCSCETADPEK